MPRLFIVCGCPGVGKSTAADFIARRTGGLVLRTDEIRKELFGPNPSYSSEESQTTYDTLFERAEDNLKSGETVVLDATFNLSIGRDNAVEVADSVGVKYQFIRVECDEDVVRERIENRDGVSDADFSIYQKIRDDFDSFSYDCEVVDNSDSESKLQSKVNRLI